MNYEKKQIAKEDGRHLVFYHFPDTASEEQTAAFRSAEDYAAKAAAAVIPTAAASNPAGPGGAPKEGGA